ncbi:hypothetical protein T265_01257 [Opisthorchis viverrini]|uniref:Uncharacterized protein n=1 Tax=Opisthorchis viverrini TaxID=6198 RepID=A0A074ZZA7_OPIVI|nr:hypothetical protein T265_01257 [Opisthorchis viverrini]KER32778.1 hypothetical protein T265_01257 [Opisthorchis viverrini]
MDSEYIRHIRMSTGHAAHLRARWRSLGYSVLKNSNPPSPAHRFLYGNEEKNRLMKHTTRPKVTASQQYRGMEPRRRSNASFEANALDMSGARPALATSTAGKLLACATPALMQVS